VAGIWNRKVDLVVHTPLHTHVLVAKAALSGDASGCLGASSVPVTDLAHYMSIQYSMDELQHLHWSQVPTPIFK